jgi:hypothetical protein
VATPPFLALRCLSDVSSDDAILDMTVDYPQAKIQEAIIDIKTRELDPALWQGEYENDPAFRQSVQNWINQLWTEKDSRIDALRAERAESAAGAPNPAEAVE